METDWFKSLLRDTDLSSLCLQISNPKALAILENTRFLLAQESCIQFISQGLLSSAEIDELVKVAEALAASDCIAGAEMLLIGLLLQNPECGKILASLAVIYEARSDYSKTIRIAKEIILGQFFNIEAAYQLAFALYKQGKSDEALEWILPHYISNPSRRISRLCGILLKSLGRLEDAVDVLTKVVESDSTDVYSARALSEIYVEVGMYQKALDILRLIPERLFDSATSLHEAVIYRFMGELDTAIALNNQLIEGEQCCIDALWTQCFNYSIADSRFSGELLTASSKYWSPFLPSRQDIARPSLGPGYFVAGGRFNIGFLTSDIGDHVVSRFLTPLLRNYPKEEIKVSLLSTGRRYESKGLDIAMLADCAISLQEYSDFAEPRSLIEDMKLDVIVETNGFTRNSGLPILAHRCAPIQCHYIGYHATTGLETIDYFLGDAITTPLDLQCQYVERLIQIPGLWMAYDSDIEFPVATPKMTREGPVLGAFSQVTKINTTTLRYWSAAMRAVPQSILVIKDRGVQCNATRERIEKEMEENQVDRDRIYFIGPVGTHFDHLDSYNAIDIALDTTPWSGATTAFEALGMGVPLVAICGDKTSSRMSTSVVCSAGMNHLVANSAESFAAIVTELCRDYRRIRQNKSEMQKHIRASILFDGHRICDDFFKTIKGIAGGRR